MGIKNYFRKLLSLEGDYSSAISGIQSAIESNVMRPTDKLSRVSHLVSRSAAWDSWIEGIDWIELEAYAEEKKIRLETVQELLDCLKTLHRDSDR